MGYVAWEHDLDFSNVAGGTLYRTCAHKISYETEYEYKTRIGNGRSGIRRRLYTEPLQLMFLLILSNRHLSQHIFLQFIACLIVIND